MNKKTNKKFLYKYIYIVIIFLGLLLLPFLLLSYENECSDVLEEYNDLVVYAISEEFEFDASEKNKLLELHAKVEEAPIIMHYKGFISIVVIFIFLGLFNYLYIIIGLRYELINNSANVQFNKKIIALISIVEIIYLICLLIFTSKNFIGTNAWTLFFVNLVLLIFVLLIFLQIQYWYKPEKKQPHQL